MTKRKYDEAIGELEKLQLEWEAALKEWAGVIKPTLTAKHDHRQYILGIKGAIFRLKEKQKE